MIKNLLIICGYLILGTSLLLHGMQPPHDNFENKIREEVQGLFGMTPNTEETIKKLVELQQQSPFLRRESYKTWSRRTRSTPWPEPGAQQTEVTDSQVQNKRSWLPATLCAIGISSIIMLFLTKKLYNKIKAYRAKRALQV